MYVVGITERIDKHEKEKSESCIIKTDCSKSENIGKIFSGE